MIYSVYTSGLQSTQFLRLGHVSAGCVVLYRADIVLQDEELKIMLGNGFFYRLLVSGGRN